MAQTPCDLRIETGAGVTLIHIAGRITVPSLPRIRDRIRRTTSQPDHRGVIIDMADVEFMDSSAIGFLISSLKNLRGAGQGFALIGLNSMALETLRVTNLIHILPIFEGLEEARRSMED
jgi:anti-sigma B factor antagonist